MKSLLRVWTLASVSFFAASIAATAATVTLTASPAEGGTVSGAGTYVAGKSASISAKANKYWAFVNWTGGATTTTVAKLKLVISNDVSLTATFTPSTGFLSFSTNSISFGSVPVTLSATQTLTLANTGPGTITVKKFTLPKGYTALPAKFAIASGASQAVAIVFKPTAVSAYNGSITVSSDAARTAAAPTIAGSGVAQTRIMRLAGDLAFGTVVIGQTASRPLSVCNDGNSPMSVTAVTWSNNTGTAFSATNTTFTVPPSGTATMSVAFSPKTSAVWNATLVLTATSLTGGPRGIAVTGTGTAGTRIIRLEGNLDFGEQFMEHTNTRPLTVYNDGSGTATVTSVNWTNNADASFSVSPASFSIAPGKSTAVNVNFAPKETKLYSNVVLVLNVNNLTSGTNIISATGGANAWANGTWITELAVAGTPLGTINSTGISYVWQTGMDVVAEIRATFPMYGSLDGVFSGSVQDRTNIVGFVSINGIVADRLTLVYSSGLVSPTNPTAPTIVSGAIKFAGYTTVATIHPRTNAANPSISKPSMLTIKSAPGRGTPRAGLYGYPYGAVLTNAVNGVQIAGGTQYVATGWTMIGNKPVSGSGTNMIMTHTNTATLTWLWKTNYALTATVSTNAVVAGGSVTGNTNGWYAAGAFVTVTAAPDTGYHFAGWSGNTPGDTNSLSQSLTMDQARTLVACFAPDAPDPVLRPASDKAAAATAATAFPAADPHPSLSLTFLATADGAAPACAPDGRCAVLTVCDGVATVAFPEGIEPLTALPVIVMQALGADTNANGLPDALDASLDGLMLEGAALLTARVVDGWLLVETPYVDRLHVEGAPVPACQLPASWQVTPRR
ncbi:MAG: choice-of-anchor D domain-containing protein [bacterium]